MSIATRSATRTTITTISTTIMKIIMMTITIIITATPITHMTPTAISPRSCWLILRNSATGTLN